MALVQRPLRESDVIITKIQSVNGTVSVPVDLTLDVGTLLTTADGGLTWQERQEDDWAAGTYAANDIVYHQGHIWKSLAGSNTDEPTTASSNWEDQGFWNANGVLVEGLEESGDANVLIAGNVVENNLTGFDEALRQQLFNQNIILK